MGLVEYVPAMTTFDYLVVAIDDILAADAARLIHKSCKNKCGILTSFNNSVDTMLNSAIKTHRCIIHLHSSSTSPSVQSLHALSDMNGIVHVQISSMEDAIKIEKVILNHTP